MIIIKYFRLRAFILCNINQSREEENGLLQVNISDKKNLQQINVGGLKERQRLTLPPRGSTISADRFNFSVRDGKR